MAALQSDPPNQNVSRDYVSPVPGYFFPLEQTYSDPRAGLSALPAWLRQWTHGRDHAAGVSHDDSNIDVCKDDYPELDIVNKGRNLTSLTGHARTSSVDLCLFVARFRSRSTF